MRTAAVRCVVRVPHEEIRDGLVLNDLGKPVGMDMDRGIVFERHFFERMEFRVELSEVHPFTETSSCSVG